MAEKMKSAEAAAPLIDNGDVKKLLSLLSKVEGDRAKEFSQLIAYVDAMGRQFDRVSAELVQVRGQLAELQQSPVKKALSAAVTGLEKGVHAARERLAAVKEQIAEGAARAVEEVKHAGLAGLNKAVSFLGVKKTLNLLRGDLHNTVTDAKATIAKVEAVGEELRSVGGHLKQAGRATVGKERQEVDASKEGRFQAGLLAPLRSFRDIVEHMEQSAGKAVGQLEKLEQAAARKPSVLDNLKKAEKPEKAAPAPKRAEPDAVPSGRRRFGPDDTGRTFPADRPPGVEAPEEPGRLRFTPSDALNEGAGDLTRDKKRRGRQQARHDTGTGAAPEGGGGRLRFTKEEQRQAGDGGTTGPEPSGAADGDTGDGTGEAGSDTGDPRQARKTDKAKRRLDKATGKAQKARDNLPTQRRVRLKKEFDEDAGRPRRRLRFEQEVKPEGKRNPLARGALAVGRAVDLKVHQKIHEVEHENVGVEAAHKAEFTAENLAHDTVRFAYRHHKRAPYAKMRKWEKKAAKANVNYLYQKTLQENPELARSTLSRLQQKRRIKKQYQKAAREAKRSAAAAKESAGLLGSAARAIVNFAGAHKGAVAIAVIVVLIVFFFASCTSSCSSMLAGGFSAMFVPSYKAEDSDIEQSELQWTQMETQLQEDIDNAERDHPGYDEYRYELDEIGHDPFQIIAFLSAMYDDFLYADVSAVLREVFDEVYTLEFIETVETRTYTDEDGDEHEYDWYILTTKLTTRDFEEVVRPRLETAEHGDLYDVYMDSLGGHQKYGNPLGFEWLGSVTSLYGYRENPTAAGTQIHRGLDIAAPAGTPIYSVQDGTVIQAVHGHASYGNYILIADDKGRETRYAHCSVLTAAEGQKVKTGDKIAEVGSTGNSTGNHLHIEIKENGQYLNPLYLLNYAYKEDSE